MVWEDLLQAEDERLVAPWVGGRALRTFERSWKLNGKLPPEHGWHEFRLAGRKARWVGLAAETPSEALQGAVKGYLVGDRLVPDNIRVETDPTVLVDASERIHLIEPGLGRFVRVSAGRFCEDGPLIFQTQEFPLGPEDAVLQAYFDEKKSVDDVADVAPALDAAFRFECWQRAEAERRRREEQERREAEERERQLEERREEIRTQLGDAEGRRAVAAVDFDEGARAALAIGGAELLDARPSFQPNEMVVQYRLDRRRYECTCDRWTLRIIDAGVCLTAHGGEQAGDFEYGVKGDTFFTLESLPSVIREADREGKLVVWRHAD